MKQDIKEIIKYVKEELCMAEDYINSATLQIGDEKDLYKSISKDELNHAEKLMNLIESKVLSADNEQKIIWNYEKEHFKEKYLKIKTSWALLD